MTYPPQDPRYAHFPAPTDSPKMRRWPWVLLGFAIAIVLSILVNVVTHFAWSASESKTTIEVTYRVTGEAKSASISYSIRGNSTQDVGVMLPWEKRTEVGGINKVVVLSATNGIDDYGKITCQVFANGEKVFENTATGRAATAVCSGGVKKD